jgi:hypothetical protein
LWSNTIGIYSLVTHIDRDTHVMKVHTRGRRLPFTFLSALRGEWVTTTINTSVGLYSGVCFWHLG